MCEAWAKIMKPEIDAAFNNGFFSAIEKMLTNGKTPEQIANFCSYELEKILTVKQRLTKKG